MSNPPLPKPNAPQQLAPGKSQSVITPPPAGMTPPVKPPVAPPQIAPKPPVPPQAPQKPLAQPTQPSSQAMPKPGMPSSTGVFAPSGTTPVSSLPPQTPPRPPAAPAPQSRPPMPTAQASQPLVSQQRPPGLATPPVPSRPPGVPSSLPTRPPTSPLGAAAMPPQQLGGYKPSINPAPDAGKAPGGMPISRPAAQPPGPMAQTAAQQALQKLQKPAGSLLGNPGVTPTPLTTSGNPALSSAAPESNPGGAAPVFAQPKSMLQRLLPILLGVFVVLTLIGGVSYWLMGSSTTTPVDTTQTPPNSETPAQPVRTTVPGAKSTVNYWGLWEPDEVMEEVITEFETANPTIDVVYTQQSHKDYRERLQTAISQGSGPDVFRFHASWVPMMKSELSPVPTTVMTPQQFSTEYYPAAYQQLQSNGQLVGLPLMYDGLVMYYNKEILDTASEQPPKTWADLKQLSRKLAVSDAQGKLQRGGVALGTSTNVEHFSDVLALLILQNGGSLTNPSSKEVQDALLFYTSFVTTEKVWNETMPSSTVAFARSEAAIMFAPSWRAHEIEALNPELDFGVAPLPQLGVSPIAWATYWAEGVNARSQSKDAAWQFVSYLNSDTVLKKLHASQSEIRSFGEIYAKQSLAKELSTVEVASVVLKEAPYAQGGFMSSYTHDSGINDTINKYYADVVTGMLQGKAPEQLYPTLTSGVAQELKQYGITVQTTSSGAGTP